MPCDRAGKAGMPETPKDDWGPDRLREVAAGIEREFPLSSRRTLLSLFDIDPDQLQAQWQVESGQLALVLGAFPLGLQGIHQRLRLLREDAGRLEVAALTLPAGELDAQGVARFLVSGGPGVLYRAELGLATPEGGWILLTRSNLATLPPRPPQANVTPPLVSGGDQRADQRLPVPTRTQGKDGLSPPGDPTLEDRGRVLEPEFPLPSAWSRPIENAGSRRPDVHQSRLATNPRIQPLVIARNPRPVSGHHPRERGVAPPSMEASEILSESMAPEICQDLPNPATCYALSSPSSPGSGTTSPGSAAGTWEDLGRQGPAARYWLFAYPSATPSSPSHFSLNPDLLPDRL